jgi:hypothetical protein
MFRSLYAMWLDAHDCGALPPEWVLFIDFRSWASAVNYKAEYGYAGAFNIENLRAAMPDVKTIVTGHLDADDLVKKMNVVNLRKLAANMGIKTEDGETKRQVAELIAAVEVSYPMEADGGTPGEDMPAWVKENPSVAGVKMYTKPEGAANG